MAMHATKRMDYPYKHPNAKLDYDLDLVNWLDTGETISSATVTRSGSDTVLELVGSALISGSRIKQWVRAGTDGVDYLLTYAGTTSVGRIFVAELIIPVRAS
jgi:hypothetical protein